MNSINYLVGSENTDNHPFRPFDDEVCFFFNTLSMLLMKTPREYPDVLSFAYWCRKANIQRLRNEQPNLQYRLGRGLAFHITPGNIPVNFAFSFAFSLLAGNCCIVRVPTKPFAQTVLITDAIQSALAQHPSLRDCIAFVDYPIDNEITAHFSQMADIRVLWGGDRTINLLRSIPAKSRCVDIAFADRYSICLLDGQSVLAADERTILRLAEQFYNDTYLMDQNACSSPQLTLWQHDSTEARERFWGAVKSLACSKYTLQPELAVEKYTKLCEDAITGVPLADVQRRGNLLYRLELSELPSNVQTLRGKGGYFYEYSLRSWEELTTIVTEKFQSLMTFGVDTDVLRQFVVEQHMRGIDRIVPIGQAMDIGTVWDGYDLIQAMSRIVALR